MKKLMVGMVGLAAMLVSAVPVGAATSGSTAEPQFCAFVLDPLEPGQELSRVVAQECAADEEDLESTLAGSTLLMYGFEHANYNEGQSGQVFIWSGSAGPCDTEGYGIRQLGVDPITGFDWNDKLSSFQTFNLCHEVNLFEHRQYNAFENGRRGFYVGSTRYVGDAMNDITTSIHVNAQV